MESKIEPIEVMLARCWADFRMRFVSWFGGVWAQWANGEGGPARHSILFLLCLGITLNLISIAAPGYYSHDEVQYGILSRDIGRALGSVWIDHAFSLQYRPFSRSFWVFLSHFFYEIPVLMHLSVALVSIFNGVLLYFLLFRVSGQAISALWGFIGYNIFPSTVWIVGWVGTLADSLWMMCALLIAHILLTDRSEEGKRQSEGCSLYGPSIMRHICIILLFVLGLLSKENFVVFPIAIIGLCLFCKPWRGWYYALFGTSSVSAIYLLMRLDILMSGTGSYEISIRYLFKHILQYWMYPYTWKWIEFSAPMSSMLGLLSLAAIAMFAPIVLLSFRRQWHLAFAFVFYYFIFSTPALIIEAAFPHYMYGSVLPVAAMVAYAFRLGERRYVKIAASVLLAVLFFHSVKIHAFFYTTAIIQTRIYNDTFGILRAYDQRSGNNETKFVIFAESGSKSWILKRAFHGVNEIEAIPIHGRFQIYEHFEYPEEFPENTVELRFTREGYIAEQ